MTSRKRVLILLFMTSVIVLLSVFYLETRVRGLDATEEGPQGSTSEAGDESSLPDDSAPASSQSVEREADTQPRSSAVPEQTTTQKDNASPFATVVNEQDKAVDEQVVVPDSEMFENDQQESLGENTPSNSSDQDDAPSVQVVVPESYPISEASRYFVPKEDRRPGNLGGPPPLDFPGGLNESAASGSGDEVLPPPVPQ